MDVPCVTQVTKNKLFFCCLIEIADINAILPALLDPMERVQRAEPICPGMEAGRGSSDVRALWWRSVCNPPPPINIQSAAKAGQFPRTRTFLWARPLLATYSLQRM